MNKIYQISVPQAALTVFLTTSVLLACTPSQQQGEARGPAKTSLLADNEMVLIEEDSKVKLSSDNLLPPVAVRDGHQKYKTAKIDGEPKK